MKLDPGAFPYLQGNCFDDSYKFQLISTDHLADREYIDRIELLEHLVFGKKVVHVGCVDHSAALVERESARGTWLHGRLSQVAKQCVGVDISEEGISYLKSKLNIDDVFCCDLTSEVLPLISEQPFDYLLLGEILEHIDNPVTFLRTLRERHFPQGVERMILTVPNALRGSNARHSRCDFEKVNTDHRYWFTPFTLAKVLTIAGFKIDDIYMVRHKPLENTKFRGYKSWKRRVSQRKHPFLRSTIVVTASIER